MEAMCNCIAKTEDKYKEHLVENEDDFKGRDDLSVEFINKAFMLDRGTNEITLPIEIEWLHTAKSGRTSIKRKTTHFTMNYCPFCGRHLRGE